MNGWCSIWRVVLVAGLSAACAPETLSLGGESGGAAREAAEAFASSTRCANDLHRAVDEDPAAVARALQVEPIRLAPYGGERAPADVVREVVAEQLEAARANAMAANALATLRDDDPARAAGALPARVALSVRAARELCGSANLVLMQLASRRTP